MSALHSQAAHQEAQGVAPGDHTIAALAAAMIATFEDKGINPDPDIWQLISDKELERALGASTFQVLNQRREKLKRWMSELLTQAS